MSSRIVRVVMPFTAVMIVLLGSARTMSQAPASTSLPRTADGQPDIHGYWFHTPERGSSLNGYEACGGYCADEPIDQHRHNVVARKSMIIDPPDGKVPWQPWSLARYKVNHRLADTYPVKPELIDPQVRCGAAGIPKLYGHVNPFQILQPKGAVVFLYQYPRSLNRYVPLDGRPHLGKNIPLWMGDSRGKWEGDTLVIDITNTHPMTWFDQVASFHSDQLHMTERWTMLDADTLRMQSTQTDPKVYTKPWTVQQILQRQKNEQLEFIVEAECNEGGNPGLYAAMGKPHTTSVRKGWVER